MNYAKMIEILSSVKELRSSGQGSHYVCDNVRFDQGRRTQDGIGLEKSAICKDITTYIQGAWSVTEYLGYDSDNHEAPEVVAFRAKMVDDLIERYTKALEVNG